MSGTGASVAFGLLFGAANLWLLTRIIAGMVRIQKVAKWKMGLYFFGKMALLLVTIGLILWRGYVTPLPFLAGFTVSLVAGLGIVVSRGKRLQDGA